MSQNRKNVQPITQARLAGSNGLSFRQAASKFGSNKTIIHIHSERGKFVEAKRPQQSILSICEEERLGNWLIYCYYLGYFPVSKPNLAREADNLLKARGSKGTVNRPWCNEFPQRQKYVQKSLDFYEKYRDLNDKFGNKWMASLLIYCTNQNLFHCLQDPRYMYYCCQLHITDSLKLIVAYSAEGKTVPPLVINVNANERTDFEELIMPHDWVKYNSRIMPSGTVLDNALVYYIDQVLKTHLVKENLRKPMLLFKKYQNYPPALTIFELWTEHLVYPVNSLVSAFKLEQNLQIDISVTMKSVTDKQMSSYVDLMNNILMFKLTKERMCESFRESGIYPLAVGEMNIKELPRLQMSSNNPTQTLTLPEVINDLGNDHCIVSKTVEHSQTKAASIKRTHSEPNGGRISCEFKDIGSNVPTLEKRPYPISLKLAKYDQMAFQNFCLDDDDIAVCNEPLQTDDSCVK